MILKSWCCGASLASACALLTVWWGCKPGAATYGSSSSSERVVQVVLAEARIQEVVEMLSLVGSLVANEQVEIKSEIDGTVQSLPFEEGKKVKEGQLLVQLDESKLMASLAEAEANFKLSAANFERGQSLIKDQLISQQEYDQLLAAYEAAEASIALKRRQLKDTRIHAPFGGVMGARMVSPGQVISRNTTLAWLADLDPAKVEIEVPERFLGQLKVGQKINIHVAAYPGEIFTGEVYFIAPYVDPSLRTALVKARLPNEDARLIPGMFANVDLSLKIRNQAVVVPEEALSKYLDDEYATLFVKDENETAQMIRVKVGVHLPGMVEILEGLSGGEQVIVEGIQKLASGVKVKTGNSPVQGRSELVEQNQESSSSQPTKTK